MVQRKKPEPKDLLDAEIQETEQLIKWALVEEEVLALKRARQAIKEGSGSEHDAQGDPAILGPSLPSHETLTANPPRIQERERGGSLSRGTQGTDTATAIRENYQLADAPVKAWILVSAWIVSGLVILMLLASYLAVKGIYIDALRPLWSPIPSDDAKWILGISLILVMLLVSIKIRR